MVCRVYEKWIAPTSPYIYSPPGRVTDSVPNGINLWFPSFFVKIFYGILSYQYDILGSQDYLVDILLSPTEVTGRKAPVPDNDR